MNIILNFHKYFFGKKIIYIYILFVCFNIKAGNYNYNNTIIIPDNIKVGCKDSLQKIFSPVIISRAPANEATLVSVNDKLKKIFFINRPEGGNKMMSISSVDGWSWSKAEEEFYLPGEAYYANQILVDREGTIHCMFHIKGEGADGYKGRTYDLWYCKKRLNEEWTHPNKIFDGYVGSMRSFLQLNSGRILIAFGKAVPEFSEKIENCEIDYGWNEIVALYSDDLGENWNTSNNTLRVMIDSKKNTRYGAIEPDIVQLSNGELWMLIRTNKGRLYESFSFDEGSSWTKPLPSKLISSDSPADILKLKDGRLIVFLNMNQRWDDPQSYAFGGREVLHAIISNDDGKTWSGGREVLRTNEKQEGEISGDRGTAYTSSIETNDGNILFVSGQGDGKSISIFSPDWLEQDVIYENSRLDPLEWTLFGVDNISKEYIKSKNKIKFTYKYKDYLELSLNNDNVVKNFPLSKEGEINFYIEFLDKNSQLLLTLNDHFSISTDSLASDYSLVSFILKNKFKKNSRIPIKITWSLEKKQAVLYIHNKVIDIKEIQRKSDLGINYLRIGYKPYEYAKEKELGFIIDSFSYNKLK